MGNLRCGFVNRFTLLPFEFFIHFYSMRIGSSIWCAVATHKLLIIEKSSWNQLMCCAYVCRKKTHPKETAKPFFCCKNGNIAKTDGPGWVWAFLAIFFTKHRTISERSIHAWWISSLFSSLIRRIEYVCPSIAAWIHATYYANMCHPFHTAQCLRYFLNKYGLNF